MDGSEFQRFGAELRFTRWETAFKYGKLRKCEIVIGISTFLLAPLHGAEVTNLCGNPDNRMNVFGVPVDVLDGERMLVASRVRVHEDYTRNAVAVQHEPRGGLRVDAA